MPGIEAFQDDWNHCHREAQCRGYAADPAAHANNVTRLSDEPAKRMRVGDFRIIFEETDTEIIVTRIAPRGDAYR